MKMKKNNKQNHENIVKIFLKLAPIIMKATPLLFWSEIILSVFHGVFWGVETMMQQRFFDEAARMVGAEASLFHVFAALGLLGLANVTCQVLNGVCNFLPEVMNKKAGGHMSAAINRKIAKLAPAAFEDAKKLDDINKAEQGKNNAIFFVVTFSLIFSFYVPYFLFMGWYLFSLKPVLAAAIVIVFMPTALAQVIRTKAFSNLEDKSAPVRREYEYYESCMVSREYFKETRLLGGFHYFKKLYLETLACLQNLRYQATMKSNLFELFMRAVTVAGYCGIMLLLFDALMKQEVTVGAFAAVFNSIGFLYSIMEEVVCRHIANMAQNAGSLRNYLDFLELEERTGTVDEVPEWGDITLENVSFSYPNAEQQAVKGASVTLKKGETLAIVGENGSGKSTLLRLISGLYLPDEGSVRFHGVDTALLMPTALFSKTSAVFQKYQRYQMTLEENIIISEPEKPYEETVLDAVCEMAGSDQSDSVFPQGYRTMLSREFDGVDLSGGQWQRVAIARGFFRSHDLIMLDEPTAAIDPYEETRIYNRFAEISRDKSAVIVTHRLGSVKLADRIIVMKNGEVVQIGTHEELITEENGEYRRLYEAQEQWYQDEAG